MIITELQVNFKLARLKSANLDYSDMMQSIQDYRREQFYLGIDRGRDATGRPFKPLTEPYATHKRARWGNKPILVASGKMINSYDSAVIDNTLIEEIDTSYAVYHQNGTSKMVKRQLLPNSFSELPKNQQTEIKKLARIGKLKQLAKGFS